MSVHWWNVTEPGPVSRTRPRTSQRDEATFSRHSRFTFGGKLQIIKSGGLLFRFKYSRRCSDAIQRSCRFPGIAPQSPAPSIANTDLHGTDGSGSALFGWISLFKCVYWRCRQSSVYRASAEGAWKQTVRRWQSEEGTTAAVYRRLLKEVFSEGRLEAGKLDGLGWKTSFVLIGTAAPLRHKGTRTKRITVYPDLKGWTYVCSWLTELEDVKQTSLWPFYPNKRDTNTPFMSVFVVDFLFIFAVFTASCRCSFLWARLHLFDLKVIWSLIKIKDNSK